MLHLLSSVCYLVLVLTCEVNSIRHDNSILMPASTIVLEVEKKSTQNFTLPFPNLKPFSLKIVVRKISSGNSIKLEPADGVIRIPPQSRQVSFTIQGRAVGRYTIVYSLEGSEEYRLSRETSIVLVKEPSRENWSALLYPLAVNVIAFLLGLAFFVVRRMPLINSSNSHNYGRSSSKCSRRKSKNINLPFWQSHKEGLFEDVLRHDSDGNVNSPTHITDREMSDIWNRCKSFFSIPVDSDVMTEKCGINAVLSMKLHADLGHLFSFLTVFSIAVILPVNYCSSDSSANILDSSLQRTTISNIPVFSEWLWAHVLFCYIIASCVIFVVYRQYTLLFYLRKKSFGSVGSRSIFIQSGLPVNLSSFQVKRLLSSQLPNGVEKVTVIHELKKLFQILDARTSLYNDYERLLCLYEQAKSRNLGYCQVWCPGSVCLPSPFEVAYSYITCSPCQYSCCGGKGYPNSPSIDDDIYVRMENDKVNDTPYERHLKRRISDNLAKINSISLEELELYQNRRSTGGAFVVFKNVEIKEEFLAMCWSGRTLRSRINSYFSGLFFSCLRRTENFHSRRYPERSNFSSTSAISHVHSNVSDDFKVLSQNLTVKDAPEPDDVLWRNLAYRSLSIRRIGEIFLCQLIGISLLFAFSTPTAVLNYLRLSEDSDFYTKLSSQKDSNLFVKLLIDYLPSLLLLIVNWVLLTFLFYLSTFELWHSESKRMQSFMSKGFFYLLLSSIVLPSIGVTTVYIIFQNNGDPRLNNFVEKFLNKVSGTFFITYVSQSAFLGPIIILLRVGERIFYQPWLLARSVTVSEIDESRKPWPFYFGYDYAKVLSIFMVLLFGTAITPVITPFGCVYYYLKLVACKYNFLYVVPYTPGRGDVSVRAYALVWACLVLFEITMLLVFLHIATRAQVVMLVILLVLTTICCFLSYGLVYLQNTEIAANSTALFNADSIQSPDIDLMSPISSSAVSELSGRAFESTSNISQYASSVSTNQSSKKYSPRTAEKQFYLARPGNFQEEMAITSRMKSYTNPYDISLQIIALSEMNEQLTIEKAFRKWKQQLLS